METSGVGSNHYQRHSCVVYLFVWVFISSFWVIFIVDADVVIAIVVGCVAAAAVDVVAVEEVTIF